MHLGLRNRLSSQFRKGRDRILRDLIISISAGANRISILDVGGRLDYWQRLGLPFLRERNVKIILLNLHKSELPENFSDGIFEAMVGNACDLSEFGAGQFDIAHSNSVIEHVGTLKNMQAFASELRRVGKSYYVQTPYFWFPVDPHYYAFPMFHWFPRSIRARLLMYLPLSFAGRSRGLGEAFEDVDSTRLLDARQFSSLFPDSKMRFERFLGLPKSMMAIRRC
ncbi:MAG TPA: methyltransferase domain-containing protein [Rhizomicrobium sp.]|nr:methyltransferase domain-containing protein [Rhizomicrobium sp.]